MSHPELTQMYLLRTLGQTASTILTIRTEIELLSSARNWKELSPRLLLRATEIANLIEGLFIIEKELRKFSQEIFEIPTGDPLP